MAKDIDDVTICLHGQLLIPVLAGTVNAIGIGKDNSKGEMSCCYR